MNQFSKKRSDGWRGSVETDGRCEQYGMIMGEDDKQSRHKKPLLPNATMQPNQPSAPLLEEYNRPIPDGFSLLT